MVTILQWLVCEW